MAKNNRSGFIRNYCRQAQLEADKKEHDADMKRLNDTIGQLMKEIEYLSNRVADLMSQ